MGEVKYNSLPPPPITPSGSSILAPQQAKEQAVSYIGHAVSMIEHLEKQNEEAGETVEKVKTIYQDAKDKLENLKLGIAKKIDQISKTNFVNELKENLNAIKEKLQNDTEKLHKATKELSGHEELRTKLSSELEKAQESEPLRVLEKKKHELGSNAILDPKVKLKYEAVKKEIKQHKEKIKKLETSLNKVDDDILQGQENINKLKRNIRESEVAENNLKNQLEVISLTEKLEKANEIKKQNEEIFRTAENDLNKAGKHKNEIKDLTEILNEDLQFVSSIEERLKTEREKKSKLDKKVSELNKNVNKLEKNKPSDEEGQQKLYSARKDLQDAKSENNRLQTNIRELEKDLNTQKAKVEESAARLKESQSRTVDPKLKEKYQVASEKLYKSQQELVALNLTLTEVIKKLEEHKQIPKDLSKADLRQIKDQFKKTEKEMVEIIRRTQIQVASEIGSTKYGGTKEKIETLAKGGWGARKIQLLAFLSKADQAAVTAFKNAQEDMKAASKGEIKIPSESNSKESKIESDRRNEFENYRTDKGNLDRRAGVIGINSIYRFQVFFSKAKIKEQLASFVAQDLSNANWSERGADEIKIGEGTFTSRLIPLNEKFDEFIQKLGTISNVFSGIFGTKGISSANRQEPHLVNGFVSTLSLGKKVIFSALRHAITADKFEKDPAIRAKNSEKAAEELLKAALLQEIASQGMTLEEVQKQGKEIQLNFNSVSLVTPDDLRPIVNFLNPILRRLGIGKQADEKQLLKDQMDALHHFDGERTFSLDGKEIKCNVRINTFNFGVNELAMRGFGLSEQYTHNQEAMKGFRSQVRDFNYHVKRAELEEKDQNRVAILKSALANAELLMEDIERLMKDKDAYLRGGNQYEIGAKILNLSNVMNQTISNINLNKSDKDRISGFKCAFNCMSGKDRTGFMDGIAKTFAILAEQNQNKGRYYSHEDFEDLALRKQFTEILIPILMQGGGLEITQDNTGFKGYKVREEARIFDMPLDQFLQIQGYSTLTAG